MAEEAVTATPEQTPSVLEQDPSKVNVDELTLEEQNAIVNAGMADEKEPQQAPIQAPQPEVEKPTEEAAPTQEQPVQTEQQPQESLVQKHQRLRSRVGRQGEELGHLRKENEQLKTQISTQQFPATPQQPTPVVQPSPPAQEGDYDPFDKAQTAQLIRTEAQKLFDEKNQKDASLNDFVHELEGFQRNHKEYQTQATLGEIDRLGQDHPEWNKMQEILDLVEFGNKNGVRNTEASFLLMQQQTGYLEQQLKDAEKRGTVEAVQKIQNAANATTTIGGAGATDKSVPKTIMQAKSQQEQNSIVDSATPEQLNKIASQLIDMESQQ